MKVELKGRLRMKVEFSENLKLARKVRGYRILKCWRKLHIM